MLSTRALLALAPGLAALLWIVLPHGASARPQATDKARQFVEDFIKQFRPLDVAANRAWWDANISGNDEDFKRKEDAQNRIDELLSKTDAFAQVKAIKECGGIDDAVTKRAIETRMGTDPDLPIWPTLATDVNAVELGKMTTGQQSIKGTLKAIGSFWITSTSSCTSSLHGRVSFTIWNAFGEQASVTMRMN